MSAIDDPPCETVVTYLASRDVWPQVSWRKAGTISIGEPMPLFGDSIVDGLAKDSSAPGEQAVGNNDLVEPLDNNVVAESLQGGVNLTVDGKRVTEDLPLNSGSIQSCKADVIHRLLKLLIAIKMWVKIPTDTWCVHSAGPWGNRGEDGGISCSWLPEECEEYSATY